MNVADRVDGALKLGPLTVAQLAAMLSVRRDTIHKAIKEIGAVVVGRHKPIAATPCNIYGLPKRGKDCGKSI